MVHPVTGSPALLQSHTCGAVADGVTLNTGALQQALDTLAAQGGGTLVLGPGTYLTGTLHLRSHVELHIPAGTTLRGSGHLGDYPPQPVSHEDPDRHPHHLFVADHIENATLSGGGTIDGNGLAFWEPATGPRNWIVARDPRVSPMFDFRHCRNLRIQDVSIVNSPGWTLHLFCCDQVSIRSIRIDNPMFGPNTDGMDINGCRDVTVTDCRVTAGDDAIVLKTTRDSRSCERIIVKGCILKTYCAALKLGTESWHDFRDIVFSDCVVFESPRAFAVYAYDGGIVENVVVSNLSGNTNSGWMLNRPLTMEVCRRAQSEASYKVSDTVSQIRNVTISNCAFTTDGRLIFVASDGGWIRGLSLSQISLNYPWVEQPREHPGGNQYLRHAPEARSAAAVVVAQNIENLHVRGLSITWPDGPVPCYWGDSIDSDNPARLTHTHMSRTPSCQLAPLWGRNLKGGVFEATDLSTAADQGITTFPPRAAGDHHRPGAGSPAPSG